MMMMMMMILVIMIIVMMMMMMTMTMTMMMLMMMMIALKGSIRDLFCNLLIVPRTVSNTYTQMARAQSCASHVLHIEHLSRATCRLPHGAKGQLGFEK